MNGIREMKYLDEKFEEYRAKNPGKRMPVWYKMRGWALPAFEIADSYAPDKNAGETGIAKARDTKRNRQSLFFMKHLV